MPHTSLVMVRMCSVTDRRTFLGPGYLHRFRSIRIIRARSSCRRLSGRVCSIAGLETARIDAACPVSVRPVPASAHRWNRSWQSTGDGVRSCVCVAQAPDARDASARRRHPTAALMCARRFADERRQSVFGNAFGTLHVTPSVSAMSFCRSSSRTCVSSWHRRSRMRRCARSSFC